MAHSTVYMTNGIEVKKAPVGFSWTMFFFGCLVPLIRADWVWFLATALLNLAFWGLPTVVLAFFYNKIYLKSLFDKGFKVHSQTTVTDVQIMNYTGYISVPRHTG